VLLCAVLCCPVLFNAMPSTRAEELKAFKDEAEKMGLKKESVTKLVDKDIDSLAVIPLLRESDIAAISLSTGQMLLLSHWVTSCHGTESTPSELVSVEETSGLQDLLGELSAEDQGQQAPRSVAGKPLYVIDHITRASSFSDAFTDSPVCARGDVQLVMRSARPKLLPEQVSLAQWVGANARIMKQLITSGVLSSNEDLFSYLDFTETIGDYAQVNTLPSLMVYDHEFRRRQAEKGRPWDVEDFHLANFHLRKKDQPLVKDRWGSQRGPSQRSSPVELCRNYNASGCLRDACRYIHACSICRVPGHPRTSHKESPTLNPYAPGFTSTLRKT